ncbi:MULTISPECIES: hypothetical protein [unclassified Nocardioides]|uniref:hypothetical protein n=1 Tax=unclassified Nocardioides TaxID=2615069 RepID=UPI0030148741
MADIWNSIKNTAKSLGGATTAPVGAVVDIASMPFDDKDDDFGSIVSTLGQRGSQALDPILNPQTLSGAAVGNTLSALNWAYENAVDHPLATTQALQQKAFGGRLDQLVFSDPGALVDPSNWRQAFDPQAWADAYRETENESFGSTYATAALGEDNVRDHQTVAGIYGFGVDLSAMLALDPAALALKGVGAARSAYQLRALNTGERGNLYAALDQGLATSRFKPTLQSRTDKWLDWTEGKNSLARPLSAPEILHGTPELKRYAAEPHVIAGLLSDTNQIANPIARRDAKRRILAVAAGDTSQIERLRTMSTETADLADALTNMAKGSTIDLKALAAQPTLRTDPTFVQRLESQLGNLNSRGDIDRFVDDFNSRIDQMLETQHTLPRAPGLHNAGKRAVKRQNETGLLRSGDNAHRALDGWAAKRATEAKSASTIFQRGLHTVPVVAVKTVGLMASPYTKAPVRVSDALRQTHFTGMASLHDWGGATTQLDSMMRLANVPAGERMETLSRAFLAKTEPEKMRIINEVEATSMKTMIRQVSEKTGRQVDDDYITTLLSEHALKRDASRASIQGRAYAATQQTPDMLARSGSAQRAEDTAALSQSSGWSAQAQGKWRVDQINDDGTPLSLPLLETQLSNVVPLMDLDVARKLVERDNGYLARLSRAWTEESKQLGRLAEAKRVGVKGVDRALEARAASADWLVNAGQMFMRGWKFSVLFRLGYPMRVLTDDHLRIWSQMGASSFYGENLKEVGANWRYNRLDRRQQGKEALHNLKVRRQEILDELDGDRMVVHGERRAELKSLDASIRAHSGNVTKLRKQMEDAETKRALGIQVDTTALSEKLKTAEGKIADAEGAKAYMLEQLGDYGPDDLKRELEAIDEAVAGGWKPLAPESRKVGSADVKLGDDTIEGAFGGEYGSLFRDVTSSAGSFDNQLKGVEDRMYATAAGGAHRTIQPGEPGHVHAWADVLNNQFRSSPVAMHFINGGSLDDFVRWVKAPEQAQLRSRLSHFAHDPEDWGGRVQALVHDYIPTDALREQVASGRVKAGQLNKMFTDPAMRPAVHGRAVADNLGTSAATLGVAKTLNRMFKYLSEVPTDRLSRHPYFNALYKSHAKDVYAVRKAGGTGRFTQADLDDVSHTARKLALRDLRQTLFDVSAHSHAAHVMRFVSPFFAAHQEGVARWWQIAADNPQIIRRYTQAFDVPRYLQIEVDENGDLVKPGSPISREHRILLQMPKAFGGDDPTVNQSSWSINEQAFNIVLQGGLTNPGIGPFVSIPVEWAAQRYADEPSIARVARVFNPYPPSSPLEGALPATFKRLSALAYGATGVDPSVVGVGEREYNAAFSQHVQDLTVDFQLKNGREPNKQEANELVERAGTEATTQMFHRFLWNAGSPTPASPRSKYNVVQQGWYKIQEQARAEGQDFEWAYERFKERWGAAYMPLIYSTSNNPGWVEADAATVGAIKHYKDVLTKVDPALSRVVIGAYAADLVDQNATLGEYSPEARGWLRDEQIRPGDSATYYSYDEPSKAFDEQLERRGWQRYGELTAALTAQAQQMGLASYNASPVLVALKRAGVEQLRSENYAFDQAYGTFDSTKFDRYLDDMRTIVSTPVLANDAERTDIQTLASYLKLRDYFSAAFQARQEAGQGGYEAQANADLRQAFTAIMGALVESNTYFEEFVWNGLVERDPYLVDAE